MKASLRSALIALTAFHGHSGMHVNGTELVEGLAMLKSKYSRSVALVALLASTSISPLAAQETPAIGEAVTTDGTMAPNAGIEQINQALEALTAELMQSLSPTGTYAVKSANDTTSGVPEDLLTQMTSSLQSSLMLASDFQITLIDQAQLQAAWSNAVEFNGADFEKLVENANFDALIVLNTRATADGIEMSLQAIGATGENSGQVIASTKSKYDRLDWSQVSGVDVLGVEDKLDKVYSQLAELTQSQGLVTAPTSFADFYHNALIQEGRGDLEGAVKSLEGAINLGLPLLEPVQKILDLYTALYGEDKARQLLLEKIRPSASPKLLDAIDLLSGKNPRTYIAEILSGENEFSPFLSLWNRLISSDPRSTLSIRKAQRKVQERISEEFSSGEYQRYFIDKSTAASDGRSLKQMLDSTSNYDMMTDRYLTSASGYFRKVPPSSEPILSDVSIFDHIDESKEISLCMTFADGRIACEDLRQLPHNNYSKDTGFFSTSGGKEIEWTRGATCVESIRYTDFDGISVVVKPTIKQEDRDEYRLPDAQFDEVVNCAGSFYRGSLRTTEISVPSEDSEDSGGDISKFTGPKVNLLQNSKCLPDQNQIFSATEPLGANYYPDPMTDNPLGRFEGGQILERADSTTYFSSGPSDDGCADFCKAEKDGSRDVRDRITECIKKDAYWLKVKVPSSDPAYVKFRDIDVAIGSLLGVKLMPINDQAIVEEVVSDPALSSGLAAGDVIKSISGRLVSTSNDVRKAMAWHSPGETVVIDVQRGENTIRIEFAAVSARTLDPAPVQDVPFQSDSHAEARKITLEFGSKYTAKQRANLQEVLANFGLYGGAYDGDWGPATERALVKFFDIVHESGISYTLSSPNDFVALVNGMMAPEYAELFKAAKTSTTSTPPNLDGTYDSKGNCELATNGTSESGITIKGDAVFFYESVCGITNRTPQSDGSQALDLSCSGEGEAWTFKMTVSKLSGGGIATVTDGGTLTYDQCR